MTWSCTVCTFLNETADQVCAICQSPHNLAESRKRPHSSRVGEKDDEEKAKRSKPMNSDVIEIDSDDDKEVAPQPPVKQRNGPIRTSSVLSATSSMAIAASISNTYDSPVPIPPSPSSSSILESSSFSSTSTRPIISVSSSHLTVESSSSSSSLSVSASPSLSSSPKLTPLEKAARRDQAKAEKMNAKLELKYEKDLAKLIQKACKGGFAEEEVHLEINHLLQSTPYQPLVEQLKQNKISYSFSSNPSPIPATAPSSPTPSSSSSLNGSLSSLSLTLNLPFTPCSAIENSIFFHRHQPTSVVNAIETRRRMRRLPVDEWRTIEKDQMIDQTNAKKFDIRSEVSELPSPQPIRTVVKLLDGADFIVLHSTNQLIPSINEWLALCTSHHSDASVVLLIHGLYALVQLESNRSLQQRRMNPSASSNAASSTVKPLRKLTEVDALIAKIWFETKGKVRFKMVGDLGDALRWIVDLTLVLARAPYKEADTVFTLVNTTRTDVSHLPISNKSSSRMRGGDDFPIRASPSDSDGDGDDDSASSHHRRKPVQSSLHESWRLFLMQIPRVSERIAMCITQAYPTFHHLWTAYEACQTEKQRDGLIQDLVLSTVPTVTAGGINSRSTRIGPAISKSVYQAVAKEPIKSTH